ncbi:hypothetical protein CFAM422_004126 [Trichoderma lentiforme]|uniref:Uncharacterized protein n=1 Tax=Trichoderma lentiforme TaxID=1567552 RepID=A0A9P5CDV2_9HYPO|nr:hypothetical protein CFAM422_004126 [Trichoderma lentiforme]
MHEDGVDVSKHDRAGSKVRFGYPASVNERRDGWADVLVKSAAWDHCFGRVWSSSMISSGGKDKRDFKMAQ